MCQQVHGTKQLFFVLLYVACDNRFLMELSLSNSKYLEISCCKYAPHIHVETAKETGILRSKMNITINFHCSPISILHPMQQVDIYKISKQEPVAPNLDVFSLRYNIKRHFMETVVLCYF